MEDEVERAYKRVVYDMDSEDEQWLAQLNIERANVQERNYPQIDEETFERLLDKLEKEAYLYQQQDKEINLDLNDIVSCLCNGLVTHEVIKIICNYWIDKRKRKNMPLVRLFQLPRNQEMVDEKHVQLNKQKNASNLKLIEDEKEPSLSIFCSQSQGLPTHHKSLKQKSCNKKTWHRKTLQKLIITKSQHCAFNTENQFDEEP